MSYLRGKQGELGKSIVKNPNGTNQHHNEVKYKSYTKPPIKGKLAAEHRVSSATIANDMAYARSVDTVAQAVGPEARQTLLAREGKVGRLESLMQRNMDVVRICTIDNLPRQGHTLRCGTPHDTPDIFLIGANTCHGQAFLGTS